MTSGVWPASAASRSWFSAAAPPTSTPAGSVGAEPVDGGADGRVGRVAALGTAWISASAAGARLGGHHRARCRGRPRRPRRRAAASAAGPTTWRAPGAPGPKAGCDLLVADAGGVAGGDDLDRGHAGAQAERPAAASSSRTTQRGARRRRSGWRQRRSPQAAKRGERCSPVCTQGSESLSTRGPELAEHRGQQRQRRRQHEDDRDHDAERHRAERGAGDEHHRRQRDQHRDAARTARPCRRCPSSPPTASAGAASSRTARRGSARR